MRLGLGVPCAIVSLPANAPAKLRTRRIRARDAVARHPQIVRQLQRSLASRRNVVNSARAGGGDALWMTPRLP
jgi:hypothetical protein